MNKVLSMLLVLAVAGGFASTASAQDAKAGEKKAAMCIGCHGIPGYQASFPEVYKVPMISGQNDKYIAGALTAYKKGERKHPTMRSIADSLTEQDMADLAAFYEASGKTDAAPAPKPAHEPSTAVAELLKKGACLSCHGEGFAKPIDPSYPKVAGQYADYLFVSLKAYKDDTHQTWGRANGIMGGVAKQFSNAELKALSKYIETLDGELKTVPERKFR